jgi:hypothetical protein
MIDPGRFVDMNFDISKALLAAREYAAFPKIETHPELNQPLKMILRGSPVVVGKAPQ